MEKIENFETKLNLLNQTYYNDYLVKLQFSNPKYFKEVMNDYIIFRTQDNYYIIINIAKPKIDKDLWFDDEKPIPAKTEEVFVNYNVELNGSKFNLKDDLYIYDPYTYHGNENLVKVSDCFKSDKIQNFTYKRDLTEEEKIIIKEIYSILFDNYVERLKKYYKRYSDKVHCRGYWVNR